MDAETVKLVLERRLRRRILQLLQDCQAFAPQGGLHGSMVRRTLDDAAPPAQQFDGDDQCVVLLRELGSKGLITLDDQRTHTRQRFGLDHLFARITDKGSRLLREAAPPDPDVEDERIIRNAE
jgi:hypothetical protein